MSDGPLFKHADEQEQIYAPQQLPAAVDATAAADDQTAALTAVDVPLTPGTAFQAAGAGTGASASTGTAGSTECIVPALGAVALARELEQGDRTA